MPGSDEVCVEIPIENDQVEEGNEMFCIQLSSDNNDIDFGSNACDICVTIMDPELARKFSINNYN